MVLSDYILRFLKFGDFERGEVRGRIEKTERDWEERKVKLKGWKKEEEKEKVVMRRNAMGIWEEESWGRG